MTYRLLDLFCSAGGGAAGYAQAGFEVVGVDIEPQPRYPFEFVQADAMTFPLDGFDAIHASPPCQDHSALRSTHDAHGTGWMLLATVERLRASGVPWVIENVPGAKMNTGLILCGTQFDLKTISKEKGEVWLRRHRLFQSSHLLWSPPRRCTCASRKIIGVYGNGDGGGRGWKGSHADRKAVMGIDWMNRNELSQSIPPAYTRFIGLQLLDALSSKP